jgi:hypothetical protein
VRLGLDAGRVRVVVGPIAGAVAREMTGAALCVFVIARKGASAAATTSPATSLSAGATPGERAGVAPPGSRRNASETDAAASATGLRAVVTGAWSFILGGRAPTAATKRRSDFDEP